MLKIRQAVLEDLPAILELYDGVIDRFQAQTGNMGWRKGVYPNEAYLQSAVQAGTMYAGWLDGVPAAGMVVAQGTDKSYGDAPWRVEAEDRETAVIHTLGVSAAFAGRGLALQMIQGAVGLARERGWKALRLDVLDVNEPAHRLYRRAGFQYVCTRKIFYESVGLADFLLYEYPVQSSAD